MSRYSDGTDRYSNSEISTWRDCRRKWMLNYFMSLAPKKRDVRYPLTVGNLVHGAFEMFYLAGGVNAPMDEGPTPEDQARDFLADKRATDIAECAEEHLATIEKSHRAALACFQSYLNWLDETGADLNLEIIGAEDKITMPGPIPNSQLNGRIDLLARDMITGDIVVLDLKMVGSITDKIRQLSLDTQCKTYALLARHKYHKPIRVAFRMVKINQRTAKTKGPQEEEYTIHLNESQLDVYQQQLEGIMGDILATHDRLTAGEHHQVVAYPSPSDSCSWKCDFFSVCPMMDDPGSDAQWLLDNAFESKLFTRPRDPDQNGDTGATVDEVNDNTEVTHP